MRFKRSTCLLLATLQGMLLLFCLPSCSKNGFKGYMKEDLSKYIKPGDYKGITYTPRDTSVTEEDIDDEILSILDKYKEDAKITDRRVEETDIAVISYVCTVNGEVIEELCAHSDSFEMWYTYNTVYESDIISAAVGRLPGEEFEYRYRFADDFVLPALDDPRWLGGKEAIFSVSIEYISEEITPSLTDEFVKKVAPECASVKEYRDLIRSELEVRYADEADVEKKSELWGKVMDNFEVLEYPESELEYYKNMMYNAYESYADENNYYSLEYFLRIEYGKPIEVFEEETESYAKDVVKEQLVLYSIAKAEGLSVSEEEYNSAAYGAAFGSGLQSGDAGEGTSSVSIKDIEEYYGKSAIESAVLQEKVIGLICSFAVPIG